MYRKSNYEKLAESLETSEEILYAIERVTDDCFEYVEDEDVFGDTIEEINENSDAYELWDGVCREREILVALPTENGGSPIKKGRKIFWGVEKFAEFDGEKWALKFSFMEKRNNES